jgi:HEAT repeat protein
MNSARKSTLFQSALLAAALLGLGYWAWQRYYRPPLPTYEGKTLEEWIHDLDDPDYVKSDRAADILEKVGEMATPSLLAARRRGDIRLYRRCAAVLVRIGTPAAKGLVEALQENPEEQRIEVPLVRLGKIAVPALRDALNDDGVAEAAARVLGAMGASAVDAVPDLIALLQKKQISIGARREAARALGRIGEPPAEVVPALIAALKDRRMEVRIQAAEALGWIGPEAKEATPALAAATQDEEPKLARKACQALSFIADPAAAGPLFEVFQSNRAEVSDEAGLALWNLGAKAERVWPALLKMAQGPLEKTGAARNLLASYGPLVVPLLKDALRDEEAARRETAAEILGRIGPPARPAVPELLAALRDKTSNVSLMSAIALAEIDPTRATPAVGLLADSLTMPATARALANIGPSARAAVPSLIAALKAHKDIANDNLLHIEAQMALARIGKPAVPAILDAMKNTKNEIAPLAAEALGWILPPPKEAIPALRQALAADRAHAGVYLRSLGRFGTLAQEAAPDLTKLLTDGTLRAEAAVALVQVDPAQADKVVPLLLKDFQEGEDQIRLEAADALARLGPAAQTAAPALVEALHDRAATQAAAQALQGIGAAAAPSLAKLLKDPHVDFRRGGISLLARLGRGAKAALPSVLEALSDEDSEVRAGAASLIEHIGTDAADAVPALSANLQANQRAVRYPSVSALGSIGPAAKEARRALVECLLDPDEEVRYAAALALKSIDPTFTDATPALINAVKDESPKVRLAAIDAVSRIAPDRIDEMIPFLAELSGKPYPLDVRLAAVEGLHDLGASKEAKRSVPWLLGEITAVEPLNCLYAARVLARIDPSQAPDVVLALAAALRTPHADARLYIVRTLGEFGPKAREALPEIESLLQDSGPGMREEAQKALRAIKPNQAESKP